MGLMSSVKKHVMQGSRRRKLEHFYSLYTGGKVLDAGVSGESRVAGENMFLETFRFSDDLYTGLGVMDLTELQAKCPNKRLVTYPGDYFPFDDKEFEWVFSNAVIEHVGDAAAQLRFVNEMLRVGKQVFFTTPNRYLPGDFFYRWCARKPDRSYWTRENLYLFELSRLNETMRASNAKWYQITKNRLLGWPMTFTVVCAS
jgi:SAM-dependent methyltransferase